MRADLRTLKKDLTKGFSKNLPGYHLAREIAGFIVDLLEVVDLQDQELEAVKKRVKKLERRL